MMVSCGTGGNKDAAGGPTRHIPVMLSQVLPMLYPEDGGRYIDATFGAGGYTRAVLEAAKTTVLAIDRDPTALAEGAGLAKEFDGRLALVRGNFSEMAELAERQRFAPADGVMLDVGVSSMQLDRAERGFSFMQDGPLDMRMGDAGASAADVVNRLPVAELANVLKVLGEERRARAIARAIERHRADHPFERTGELVETITRVLGRPRDQDKHPATRTFQALRIYVNGELDALAEGLAAAERVLRPGGRLVVVTFHSLEDRIVKRFFRLRSGKVSYGSRHFPEDLSRFDTPSFQIVNPRPLSSSNEEARANPRARSARLRAGERTDAPAHELDLAALGVPSMKARPISDLG